MYTLNLSNIVAYRHILFVPLRSTVNRHYISVYIYGLAACQISRGSLPVAVGPRDQESFRMVAILLGYF